MKDHERNMDGINGKTKDGSLFFFIGRWLERYKKYFGQRKFGIRIVILLMLNCLLRNFSRFDNFKTL